MTEHQPTPQGRTGQAWRTLLARCRRVEADNRALRARLAEQPAQGRQGGQE